LILHLDLSTGASGDKLLGSLLELCEKLELASFDELTSTAKVLLPHVVVKRQSVVRRGIAATHITVDDAAASFIEDSSVHGHHRHWGEIREFLASAVVHGLVGTATAELVIRVFTRIAEAEALVHGVSLEQVCFHEVGAADSIIDILFSSFLLDRLNPTAVYATPLALGSGTVVCAHGELPVPAPATIEILSRAGTTAKCNEGMDRFVPIPTYASSHEGELTTPTGAALVVEFVTAFAPLPCSHPLAIGYGAGSREIPGAANVLRAISAEPATLAGLEAQEGEHFFVEGVTQLECNIDHINAETIAFACEELLAAGALDVWQEPITMKKGRLATKMVALTRSEQATRIAQKIVELTGSLGVRSSYLERTVIPRTVVILDTPYGPVPFKAAEAGTPDSRIYWLRPEHDAVASLSRERDLNYLTLYTELQEYAKGHCLDTPLSF